MKKSKNKKSGKAKAIGAILTAGAMITGLCCLGYASRNIAGKWFGNFKDISSWHWSDKITSESQYDSKLSEGGVIITPVKDDGVIMTARQLARAEYEENGIDAQVESAYYLTATLKPEPTDSTVIWEVSWVNGSSSWAKGKSANNYISITTGQDTRKATVTCNKSFGEPINIKATSKSNIYATSTCRVDYVKKVTEVTFADIGDGFSFAYGYQCNVLATYSDYTVDSEMRFTVEEVYMNPAFLNPTYIDKLIEKGNQDDYGYDIIEFFEKLYGRPDGTIPFNYDRETQTITFDKNNYSENAMNEDNAVSFFNECLAECIIVDGCEDVFIINFKIETLYNGEVVSSIRNNRFAPRLDTHSFEIIATNLRLNYGNIKF